MSMAQNRILSLDIRQTDKQYVITPKLVFQTSKEIKEAIDNGIRLYLIVKAEIYQPNSWWFDKTLAQQKIELEISYSSLLKLYQVKNKQSKEQLGFNTYEELWQGFANLAIIKFSKNNSQGHQLKVRVVLDKGALPTAMQLPVLFNSSWAINTKWYSHAL